MLVFNPLNGNFDVVSDPATSSKLGTIELTNHLGGTATSPTVVNFTLSGDASANSHKITNLTNGSNAQDAAAFGQIPTSLPPSGSAGGDLTGSYPNPTIKSSVALSGSPTTTTQSAGDNTTKIATDAFVQTAINNAIAGVNPAVAVSAATTSASNTSGYTYNNGASGVGATLTGVANTALTVDGFTFSALGQRLLVKNDTQSPSGAFNGVYYVTQLQTALLPLILSRALDYDMPSDINNSGAIPVVNGTTQGTTTWVLTSTVNTVGTDPLTYVEFTLNPSSVLKVANNLSDVANATTSLTNILPTQTGQSGKVLSSNGTTASWQTVSASTQRTFAYFAS